MIHFRSLTLTLIFILYSCSASANGEINISSDFLSGFTHPLLGWDHVVAMVAVGLWGAFLGRPSIWGLPISFPVIMLFGGALGFYGVDLPLVETGIAASAIVLGAMITFVIRPPLWYAMIIVGIFAIYHGHAHGTELPNSANPFSYSLGFFLATGLLHLIGITLGFFIKWPIGKIAAQILGVVIILVGISFL